MIQGNNELQLSSYLCITQRPLMMRYTSLALRTLSKFLWNE